MTKLVAKGIFEIRKAGDKTLSQFVFEDASGRKYSALFASRTIYDEQIAKSYRRLIPVPIKKNRRGRMDNSVKNQGSRIQGPKDSSELHSAPRPLDPSNPALSCWNCDGEMKQFAEDSFYYYYRCPKCGKGKLVRKEKEDKD